jgi:hypothetical protein
MAHDTQAMIDAHKDGRRLACLSEFTRSDLDNYALQCFDTADERVALIAGFLAEKRRICPEWFAVTPNPFRNGHVDD